MAARLGHEAARLAAPEWEALGEIDWRSPSDRREASEILAYQRVIVSFLCDCAERVLGIFEKFCPEDTRPRSAIEATRAWVINPSTENRNWVDRAASAAFFAADVIALRGRSGGSLYAANSCAYAAYVAANTHRYTASMMSVPVVFNAGSAVASAYGRGMAEEHAWQSQRLARYLLLSSIDDVASWA